jgi:TolB-like protein/cytochrome c-type biogenesis protein CcmH/NrfG
LNPTVFISYASEDAAAAQRISAALQAAGIAVWFDQSELRGGDAWDQHIRQRIHDCALFIPVISAHSEARREGYFRREWRLAADRTQDMSDRAAFVVPVVIDGTAERGADVPETFHRVQWTRIPGGDAPAAFCERIKALLGGGAAIGPETVVVQPTMSARASPRSPPWMVLAPIAVVVLLGVGWQLWRSSAASLTSSEAATAPVAATATVFAPPPHSIAVLPFVNMSGDKEQEYFSEGLTEEILDSLARMNELQVAARTSSFSFQGEHPDIATVAHKLNVAAILEGSVRRSAHTVRIAVQLVNGVTGFQLWSQTYDRDLGDVLKLQTEIAEAVASAMKVTLLGDPTARIELGGTRNADAFSAFLRARKAFLAYETEPDLQGAIANYAEPIRLDPGYAQAYAARAGAFADYAITYAKGKAYRDYLDKGLSDARQSVSLAPALAEGHAALASLLVDSADFVDAKSEYERALALAPGNAGVLTGYGIFTVRIGHTEAGLTALRRAVQLDPLSVNAHDMLGRALIVARRYREAIATLTDARALDPKDDFVAATLGYAYYLAGDRQRARSECESSRYDVLRWFCLAQVYKSLGRRTDAENEFAQMRQSWGEDDAVQVAMIYAEWGDKARALDSLEIAMKHPRDTLLYVKTGFDSLRKEPRFQAIVKALKFPD